MTLVNPLDVREVVRPKTLPEALAYLERRDITFHPLAGGTAMLTGVAAGIEGILDLSHLGLRYVRDTEDGLHVGAMTTLQDLIDVADLAAVGRGVLALAAHAAAPYPQRQQRTLGGTVVAADSPDDVLVALLALGAQVVCYRPRRRDDPYTCDLPEFWQQIRPRRPYLITEIVLPALGENVSTSLQRVGRTPASTAIVSAGVTLWRAGNVSTGAWVAVGGVGAVPVRLPDVEALLVDRQVDDALLAEVERRTQVSVQPSDDWLASADYRRHVAGVLVRRAVAAAWDG